MAPRLIAIVGPTASGKSDLAMRIAQDFDGEIICADSRTIYKGMDVGAAKPSTEDQSKIKHWGLDLVELDQRFTVADFKKYAQAAIEDIQNRGKLAILVGGTGLYVDAVLYDFEFRQDVDLEQRQDLEAKTIDDLQAVITQMGYDLPVDPNNKRRLIRVIESGGESSSKKPIREDAAIFGLLPSDDELKSRIAKRVDYIFNNGLEDETKALMGYGEAFEANAGIGYKICARLIKGEIDEDTAKEQFKAADWQYARRQKTWFKRNQDIKWFNNPQDAYTAIKSVVD